MSSEKTTIDKNFNDRLKILIKQKLNITQKEFANNIGISSGYLSMVTTGKRGPSAEMMIGIYVNYREYFDWLIGHKPKNTIQNMKPIIQEINEWYTELISKNTKRIDWFELEFEDTFPMYKQWKIGKDYEKSKDSEIQASKIA
ncbi:helix-turn-helix domain-containing protein [Desulfogranum japonicum]|uniref:helix-turn-helix domain-containing protein n=1 Tax=Desulfogranum japonicum TaxID=231447 RepID=UPI0006867595|nr:helix-turn-helix domain-containing protein [Desulfogranum japonicum]